MRLVATFTPQAWINDYAHTVDAEGPTEWDPTAYLAEHAPHVIAELEAGEFSTWNDREDLLKGDPNAPEWVREWSGPFEIDVRDSEQ